MAAATHPRDWIRQETLPDPAGAVYTEILVEHECDEIEVFMDPDDANPQPFLVKHRSDAGGEDFETVQPTERWRKNEHKQHGKPTHDMATRMRVGDTIGFFLGTANGQTFGLMVKERTDSTGEAVGPFEVGRT